MDVNAVIEGVGGGEKGSGEEMDGKEGTDAAKKMFISAALEIEPFKTRYLKHPSFTRYSSYGHNKGATREGEGRGGGDGVMEIKRGRTRQKTLKDSTSERGSSIQLQLFMMIVGMILITPFSLSACKKARRNQHTHTQRLIKSPSL